MSNEPKPARLLTVQITLAPPEGIFDLKALDLEKAIRALPFVLEYRQVAVADVKDPRSGIKHAKADPGFF